MARILVVDDDPAIRDLVVQKLSLRGHTSETAADGVAALQAAASFRPHVILLDWMMPRMTGIEVCRRLRYEETTADVHIIVMTARTQLIDVQEGYSAGADDYVVKPFSPRELIARVDAALAPPVNPVRTDLSYHEARRLARRGLAAV